MNTVHHRTRVGGSSSNTYFLYLSPDLLKTQFVDVKTCSVTPITKRTWNDTIKHVLYINWHNWDFHLCLFTRGSSTSVLPNTKSDIAAVTFGNDSSRIDFKFQAHKFIQTWDVRWSFAVWVPSRFLVFKNDVYEDAGMVLYNPENKCHYRDLVSDWFASCDFVLTVNPLKLMIIINQTGSNGEENTWVSFWQSCG